MEDEKAKITEKCLLEIIRLIERDYKLKVFVCMVGLTQFTWILKENYSLAIVAIEGGSLIFDESKGRTLCKKRFCTCSCERR